MWLQDATGSRSSSASVLGLTVEQVQQLLLQWTGASSQVDLSAQHQNQQGQLDSQGPRVDSAPRVLLGSGLEGDWEAQHGYGLGQGQGPAERPTVEGQAHHLHHEVDISCVMTLHSATEWESGLTKADIPGPRDQDLLHVIKILFLIGETLLVSLAGLSHCSTC